MYLLKTKFSINLYKIKNIINKINYLYISINKIIVYDIDVVNNLNLNKLLISYKKIENITKKIDKKYYYIIVPYSYSIILDSYLKMNSYGCMSYLTEGFSIIYFVSNIKEYNYYIYFIVIMSHISETLQIINESRLIDIKNMVRTRLYTRIEGYLSLKDYIRSVYFKLVTDKVINSIICFNKLEDLIIAKKYNINIKGSTDISGVRKYINKIIENIKIKNILISKVIEDIDILQKDYNICIYDTLFIQRCIRDIQNFNLVKDLNFDMSINNILYCLYNSKEIELNIHIYRRVINLFFKINFKQKIFYSGICSFISYKWDILKIFNKLIELINIYKIKNIHIHEADLIRNLIIRKINKKYFFK